MKNKRQKLKDICKTRHRLAMPVSKEDNGVAEIITNNERTKTRTSGRLGNWEDLQNGMGQLRQSRYILVSFIVATKVKNTTNIQAEKNKQTNKTHLQKKSNWDFHRFFSCNCVYQRTMKQHSKVWATLWYVTSQKL